MLYEEYFVHGKINLRSVAMCLHTKPHNMLFKNRIICSSKLLFLDEIPVICYFRGQIAKIDVSERIPAESES